MSCNCNNQPCSCPSANCACPPSYVVNPATLTCVGTTCEDTIQTSCIFTDSYLSCTAKNISSSLDSVLLAMDAKICECAGCSGNTHISPTVDDLSDYWVDSSNTVPGDGSVTNPFQTITQAYNKIIGSGSTTLPDNPNVTVHVAEGVGYTTSLNIYLPTITYIFAPNAVVSFTGTGYFIDSSIFSTSKDTFRCYGYIEFNTTTGGFCKNTNNVIIVEAHRLYSSTTQSATPLFSSSKPGSVQSYTQVNLKNYQSLIISGNQNCISYTGGAFTMDLMNGYLIYGMNPFNGQGIGSAGGNIISHTNINTLSDTSHIFLVKNGFMWSNVATSMISTSGVFVNFIIDNIRTASTGSGNSGALPATFLTIGTLVPTPVTNDFVFLLKDVYLNPINFTTASPPYVINYTGNSTFDYLQMENCILYNPLDINPLIRIGKIAAQLNTVGCYNVIKGQIRMHQLPTSSSGLTTGTLWSNSGVITIA